VTLHRLERRDGLAEGPHQTPVEPGVTKRSDERPVVPELIRLRRIEPREDALCALRLAIRDNRPCVVQLVGNLDAQVLWRRMPDAIDVGFLSVMPLWFLAASVIRRRIGASFDNGCEPVIRIVLRGPRA
jgi:hypothetical protein